MKRKKSNQNAILLSLKIINKLQMQRMWKKML